MTTIADRLDRIRFLLGNRTDIDSRIVGWGADAYLELGSSVPFVELENTVDDVFIPSPPTVVYAYPAGARSVKSLVGFVSAGSPYPIHRRDIRVIEKYQTVTPGRVTIWAPFKDSIVVRPSPATADVFRWRLWMKPTLATVVANTVLLMPEDWLIVFDHMAAMQGNMALGQAEKAGQLNQLLHGDPHHP